MRTKKLFTVALGLFFVGFLQAQYSGQPTGEVIVYLTNPMTASEFADFADDWNSVVTTPPTPGGQIGVMQPISYPFPDPNNPSIIIAGLNNVPVRLPDDPEGDGGAINIILPPFPAGSGNSESCQELYSTSNELGETPVILSILDTGLEYDGANQNGYSFNNVNELLDSDGDGQGHGTHVATVAHNSYINSTQSTLNGIEYNIGAALGSDGTGTLADMILLMEEALNMGSQIINCSFTFYHDPSSSGVGGGPSSGGGGTGGGSGNQNDNPTSVAFDEFHPLYLLMSATNDEDVLFICAAGNDGEDLDNLQNGNFFPAAYPLDNIITVASHNCASSLSSFSNFGEESVDIATTGENILGLNHLMEEVSSSGTSQAAAIITGGAVVLASNSETFNAQDIKCAIIQSAIHSHNLDGRVVANGYYDLDQALNLHVSGCTPIQIPKRERAEFLKVEISPNPFVDETQVSFELEESGSVKYTIYNTSGQIVLRGIEAVHAGKNQLSINFDNLASGNYFILRLETNEHTTVTKLVRQ